MKISSDLMLSIKERNLYLNLLHFVLSCFDSHQDRSKHPRKQGSLKYPFDGLALTQSFRTFCNSEVEFLNLKMIIETRISSVVLLLTKRCLSYYKKSLNQSRAVNGTFNPRQTKLCAQLVVVSMHVIIFLKHSQLFHCAISVNNFKCSCYHILKPCRNKLILS